MFTQFLHQHMDICACAVHPVALQVLVYFILPPGGVDEWGKDDFDMHLGLFI